jgi:formylglycine-generating enzyme required for sulfatase activity
MGTITVSLAREQLRSLLLLLVLVLAACAGITGGDESDSGGEGGETATATPAPTILEGAGGGSIVFVEGGPFVMGSDEGEPGAEPDEMPKHRVNVPGFWIHQTEVTNEQYAQCVEAGECGLPAIQSDPEQETHYGDPAYGDHPVVGVSWFQANGYCDWLGGRLPTEAEWEKTARGLLAFTYPWGADDPDCLLANKEGCNADGETDPIGTRPQGLSPFEAFDMAGNVGEWTYDWYTPDYATAGFANPQGPAEGELKVWRGGGFSETNPNIRTADRNALDPEDYLPNLGFRCVLSDLGEEHYAPFCQDLYVGFCNPGGSTDGGLDHPDRPGGQQGDNPNLRITGFGCPESGQVQISVDLGLPSGEGYEVSVNGLPFEDCFELPEYPGRLYCKGPAAPMGSTVEVTVCLGQGNGEVGAAPGGPTLITYQPQTNSLVAYTPYQQTAPDNLDQYCPEGYKYNPLTGQCEYDGEDTGCPEGWTYNKELQRCEPDDESGCPEGSFYDPQYERCVTEQGDCEEGYYFAAFPGTNMGACEPDSNDDGGGLCPLGYYYNREINCCSPLPEEQTGFACEEGYYYDTLRGLCVPLDDNGCPAGTVYDPYKGCVELDGNSENPPYGQCPEGTHLSTDGSNTCLPDNPNTNGATYYPGATCPEGYSVNEAGQCVPSDGGPPPVDCGETALTYYDPNIEQCIETTDGCGLGYYYDERTQTCLPETGPGSMCGFGYMFSAVLNCCVPIPGGDGTECPGDGEPNGSTAPPTYFAAAQTNFDYGNGYCDPGDNPCPPGYSFSENRNACVPDITEDDCPEGTTYDEKRQVCVPDEPGDCPEGYGYLTALNACQPGDTPPPTCDEGYYFDTGLGYCVPTDDDGCGLGYLTAAPNTCTPQGEDPNGQCPTGYYYDTLLNTCVPIDQGGGCWTVLVDVPVCQQPTVTPDPRCGVGKRWNEQTQSCESTKDDPTATPGVDCSDYNTANSCEKRDECDWVFDQRTYTYSCTEANP